MLEESELLKQISTVTPDTSVKQDELEILFEGPQTYTVAGEEVTIRSFKFGELPRVIGLLRGVGGTFAHYQKAGTLNSVESLMDIIAVGGEQLIQTLAINIGKPRSWFDEIDADVGAELLINFLKMNIGFFMKRVVPVLQKTK